MRAARLLAAVALLVLVGVACVPPPEPASVPDAGFSEGHYILSDSDAELARRLDGMAATGASIVRLDVPWSSISQQGPGTYGWSNTDRIVNAARARGMRVLMLLAYTPTWARPAGTTQFHPPSNPADFGAFARVAAQRYGVNGIAGYEIWNEENHGGFWKPGPNPALYTQLLQHAYVNIKRVAPAATVLVGGFSSAPQQPPQYFAPVNFLQGIYAAGGRGYFDAVAHHPSNFPNMPSTFQQNYNDNAFAGVTPVLHQTMQANGDGAKKIWGTEIGAPTYRGMTYEYVADYVTEAYELWRSWSYTGPLLWYSYRDGYCCSSTDINANYGLVRFDHAPKQPALNAFISVINS